MRWVRGVSGVCPGWVHVDHAHAQYGLGAYVLVLFIVCQSSGMGSNRTGPSSVEKFNRGNTIVTPSSYCNWTASAQVISSDIDSDALFS